MWLTNLLRHVLPGLTELLVLRVLQLAPAIGGFTLATELAGYLYDRTAAAQGQHHNCRGPQCFRYVAHLL
jgi:hypothetical protein